MLDREKAEATVRYIVSFLASSDYDALALFSVGDGLSADELRHAIKSYGSKVVAEPFDASKPEPLDDGSGWWTDVDLYAVEGGLSDLTLSLTIFDTEKPLYDVRIDDLHVL